MARSSKGLFSVARAAADMATREVIAVGARSSDCVTEIEPLFPLARQARAVIISNSRILFGQQTTEM